MSTERFDAPGRPGHPPNWGPGRKSGLGTAIEATSRVWFTIGRGTLNEVFYRRPDLACTQRLELIVTDDQGFHSVESQHTTHVASAVEPGVPPHALVNTCTHGRYRVDKDVVAEPVMDVVLQRTRFVPLVGALGDYRVHVVLAPQVDNAGWGNTAWVGEYKGRSVLFAQRRGTFAAMACTARWRAVNAGFAGVSDGLADVASGGRLARCFRRAGDGNVVLIGELDLAGTDGEFVIALGFAGEAADAAQHAVAALVNGFDDAAARYASGWRTWQQGLTSMPVRGDEPALYRASTAVLRTLASKALQGGSVASLATPWGESANDGQTGTYHAVWTRDVIECRGALMAAGAQTEARDGLRFLRVTQEREGTWPQNMWLDGDPHWMTPELDEVALPILFADLTHREGCIDDAGRSALWPTIRAAAGYIVRAGPVAKADRWEDTSGYTPFTLGASIAALLVAADLALRCQEASLAEYLRETADAWNASLERWLYKQGGPLAERAGVPGYYARTGEPLAARAPARLGGADADTPAPLTHRVSPDALALVRFGLRAADDPRIVATVRVIDAELRVELPGGPCWRRYTGDAYGEHTDGSPFAQGGVGRAWPLLTGERAHYELAAGRPDVALTLLHAMEAFASPEGLLPEQVWDAPDLPDHDLRRGQPTGSATPLGWAHAEYIKLCRSLHDGRVFDLPRHAAARYGATPPASRFACFRPAVPRRSIERGRVLRVETHAPAAVHWRTAAGLNDTVVSARDTGIGMHVADLATAGLGAGTVVQLRVVDAGGSVASARIHEVTID